MRPGERAGRLTLQTRQTRHADRDLRPLLQAPALQTVHAAEEGDILGHGQVPIETESLRHVADGLTDLLRLAVDVEAAHRGRAGGG